MTFDKKYNPKIKEKEIKEFWEREKIYKFNIINNNNSYKNIFSVDTPPPTISGRMHIGHAYSYSQQDFIARYKRMKGYNVFFPFGTDDNGLATEKLVQKEKKINLRKISREEAIKICLNFLNEERPKFIEDWKTIGMSCDFNLKYSTIDKHSRKISQKSFIELYKKGLLIRKEGPIMWDRVFETAIAQAELEDKKKIGYFCYIKAKIKELDNTYVIYATTRPEMLFACVGISINKNDYYVKLKINNEYWIISKKRYKEILKDMNIDYEKIEEFKGDYLVNKNVIIPKINKEVTVSHDIAVDSSLGTGIVYFCTFGGIEDIEWASRHNIKPIIILDTKGRLNELCGEYSGKLTEEARKLIIKELENRGILIKKEKKEQIVNVGERSGVEIEFIISKQWYVKLLDKKEMLLKRARELNWYPEHMKQRLENWIKGLKWDWSISRQRHFGIPIPVWYDKEGNIYLPDEKQLPVDPLYDRPLSARKDLELIPETDVLDTWFTSASSPFLALELLNSNNKNKNFIDKLIPMDLRPQAHDIINFWLFYTLAKTNLLLNKNPFKDVIISGWVLASDGTKMSKSKGNVISPQEIINKYSADGLRFAAASTKLGQDIIFKEKDIQTGIKLVNKLYNANKFASLLLKNFNKSDKEIDFNNLKTIDRWIIAKAQPIIKEATKFFDSYEYSKAKSLFTNYFLHDIADNYIEIIKHRLWNPDIYKEDTKKAQKALFYSLYTSLKGLAPFLPYITEEIYLNFYKKFEPYKSIHLSRWPEYIEKYNNNEITELGNNFVEIVSKVRKYKAEKQVSMKHKLKELIIHCDEKNKEFIKNSIEDLKSVTNADIITIKDSNEFNIKIID